MTSLCSPKTHHKRNTSSKFESNKHQENIDKQLLADNKLYCDESPISKKTSNGLNVILKIL